MKLIDEKGRLFGIINIIDLAVIIIVVLIAGAVGYKLFGGRASGSGTAKKEIIVTVKCAMVTETAAKAISPKDRILSGTGYTNGVVKEVTYENAHDTAATSDGKLVWAEHPVLKDVFVKIEMHEDPGEPLLKLGNQEIRIGKDMFFKTQRVELIGVVQNIEVK